MKTKGWLVAAILFICVSRHNGFAQCSNTIRTVTYDTVITGVGANEDPYIFTFPFFNADSGTLMDVHVASVVTLNYTYDVENSESLSKTFRQKVTRYDDIVSPLLPGGALSYSRTFPTALVNPQNSVNYYSHTLAATDNVAGSGPDYAAASLNLLAGDSVLNSAVNVANFIGTGDATFEYYSTIHNVTLNGQNTVFNTSASDQITLSVTYTYCDNIMLAPGAPRLRPQPVETAPGRIFPNPASGNNFTLVFDDRKRGDWLVEIYNSTGQLVDTKRFPNALRGTVNTSRPLTIGLYLIKAFNQHTQQSFSERLLVK